MTKNTIPGIVLVFSLFLLATTAALAADAPQPADKIEDDKQRIARLEQRIEGLQGQIDELQASQEQQNELLRAQFAEIEALKEGRTVDDLDHQVEGQTENDLGRQVKALKERLDALERPVR